MRRLIFVLTVLFSALVQAQVPTSQPSDDYAITPMRIQTIRGRKNYLYVAGEATIENIKPWIDANFNPLRDMFESGKLQAAGPAVFVFTSTDPEMAKPLKIEAGMPVKPDVAAFDQYKTRPLPPLHAATYIFSGSLANLTTVYEKIYPEIYAAGLKPTGESRETYLHFEGMDSPNNIVLIQVGISDEKSK